MRKKEKWILIVLIIAYLLSRLINLTSLPIFNDEAIYLHWAQIMADTPEKFFSVAFDGKQPLGMWLFGVAMSLIKDPLVAGRAVSIIFGLTTLLGVFFLGKELGGFKMATISSLCYIGIPYSLFFDRMALMESMISSIAIWTLYLVYKIIKRPTVSLAIIFGIILGLGFWIKSTALIPLFLAMILILGVSFKKKKWSLMTSLIIGIMVMFLILLPLIIQPSFPLIFRKNQEFLLSLSEIFHFPLTLWLNNLAKLLEILSGYISPLFLPVFLLGILFLVKEKRKNWYILIAWNLLALSLLVFTSKNLDTRYLFFTVPSLMVFCSLILIKYPILLLIFILPSVFLSTILVSSPASFFGIFPEVSSFATDKYQYITGWPSGFGVNEAISFVKKEADNRNILVGVRLDSGNPEDAIWIYLASEPQIKVVYFLKNDDFWQQLKIASKEMPIYFISRDNQLLDHESDMVEIARFTKPGSKSFLSVQKIW